MMDSSSYQMRKVSPESIFFLLVELSHGLNKKINPYKEPHKWPWKKDEDSSPDVLVWACVKRRNRTKVWNIETMWIQSKKKGKEENTCNICCSGVVRPMTVQSNIDLFQVAHGASSSNIQLFRLPLWSSDL